MTGGGGKAVARLVHQARDKTVTEIGAKPLLLRSKRTPKRPHCEHDSSSSSSTSTTLGALTVNMAHTKRQDRKAAVKSGWWHGAPRCAATHAATHGNTLQHTATLLRRQDCTAAVKRGWWRDAPRCAATLAATHGSTLQRIATPLRRQDCKTAV